MYDRNLDIITVSIHAQVPAFSHCKFRCNLTNSFDHVKQFSFVNIVFLKELPEIFRAVLQKRCPISILHYLFVEKHVITLTLDKY